MANRVLALDLGCKTGWAYWNDGVVTSGTWKHTQTHEHWDTRYLQLEICVDLLHESDGIEHVYYEHVVAHKGSYAAQIYGGFKGALVSWCFQQSIRAHPVPVGTIKKFATGKGNAKKPQMIEAAKKFCPFQKVLDDNQADALCILAYALKEAQWKSTQ